MICEGPGVGSLRTADAFPVVASLPPKNREATTGNASARLAGEGPYTILYPRRKLKNVINEKGGSPCSFLWRNAVLRSHQTNTPGAGGTLGISGWGCTRLW